jgi:hypothetical protein
MQAIPLLQSISSLHRHLFFDNEFLYYKRSLLHDFFLIKKPVFSQTGKTRATLHSFSSFSESCFVHSDLHRTQSVPAKVKWVFSEIVSRPSNPPVCEFCQGPYPHPALLHQTAQGSFYQRYQVHGRVASARLPAPTVPIRCL